MTYYLRSALCTGIALVSLGTVGCKTKCVNNTDGTTTCTAESLVGYIGIPVDKEAPWQPGENITINVGGGNVRLGAIASTAISVTVGSEQGIVRAHFTPVIAVTANQKAEGETQMRENLNLDMTTASDGVAVTVTENGTHDSSLSARVDLILPKDFNGGLGAHAAGGGDVTIQGGGVVTATAKLGAITIQGATGPVTAETANGSIVVSGALRGVTATSGLGNINVTLGGPAQSTDTGRLVTQQGNITFHVPAASDIAIQAASGDQAAISLSPATLPAGWQAAPTNTATRATFVGNLSSATPWVLDASAFFTSKVDIDLF